MALLAAIGFQPWVERWNIDSNLIFEQNFELPDPVTGEWSATNVPAMRYVDGRYPGTYGATFRTTAATTNTTGYIQYSMNSQLPRGSTVIVGFGLWKESGNTSSDNVFGLRHSGAGINYLNFDNNGRLHFEQQPDGFRSRPVNDGVWHYVEVKIRFDNSEGYLELRIDGEVEYLVDGVDTSTANNSNTVLDNIRFVTRAYRVPGVDNVFPISAISDIYICDDTGPDNNDFLGDVVVQTLRPNANGSVSDLMGSDGDKINNFALVNALNPTAENYVESAVVGDRDLYNMSDLVIPGDVLAVQSKISASKDGVGFGTMRSVLSNGASEAFGASNALSTGDPVLKQSTVFERDPDNLYWTEQSVNDLQVGVEVGDV